MVFYLGRPRESEHEFLSAINSAVSSSKVIVEIEFDNKNVLIRHDIVSFKYSLYLKPINTSFFYV